MIVEAGIAEIINDMSDLITSATISSASTSPTFGDTSISGGITTVALTNITPTNTTLTAQAEIDSLTANGNTIRKIGVLTPSALFSNDNHPDIDKTSSEQIRYLYKISMARGN